MDDEEKMCADSKCGTAGDDKLGIQRTPLEEEVGSCSGWMPLCPAVMSEGALTVDGTIGVAGFLLKKKVRIFIFKDDFAFLVFDARLALHFLLLKCWLL